MCAGDQVNAPGVLFTRKESTQRGSSSVSNQVKSCAVVFGGCGSVSTAVEAEKRQIMESAATRCQARKAHIFPGAGLRKEFTSNSYEGAHSFTTKPAEDIAILQSGNKLTFLHFFAIAILAGFTVIGTLILVRPRSPFPVFLHEFFIKLGG